MKTIGERIVHIREKILDWTQEQLATELGVTRGAVGNWELNGKIKYKNAKRLAEASGVLLDWILEGNGPTPIPSPAQIESHERARSIPAPSSVHLGFNPNSSIQAGDVYAGASAMLYRCLKGMGYEDSLAETTAPLAAKAFVVALLGPLEPGLGFDRYQMIRHEADRVVREFCKIKTIK